MQNLTHIVDYLWLLARGAGALMCISIGLAFVVSCVGFTAQMIREIVAGR